MFLHSGASLHGHEFSRRPSQDAGGNRPSAFLRTAFSTTPTNRTPPAHAERQPSPEYFSSVNESVTIIQQSQESAITSSSIPSQMVSEDEGSITDSDLSRMSSVRRSKRRSTRLSTNYVLAHPPPKLRTKQRIMHIRPNLLLQIQHVAPGHRPRPTIDVYPSSGITGSIIAPLLKRFPRIASSKRELSIHDIMLLKSEDYSEAHSISSAEGDEDGIMSRDLMAILSPLQFEDKAEIVLADGTVWVAATRGNGNSFSYEFTSVDANGKTTTVRWVRRQPTTAPPSPGPSPFKAESPDAKFTFSVIDPDCRRHPILATLTSSSLSILDQYTTVSQSAGKHPPTSPALSPPSSPFRGDAAQPVRETRPVEEWHKSLIMISSIWVALRHGWAPNMRPEDLMPSRSSTMGSDIEGGSHARRRSSSTSAAFPPTCENTVMHGIPRQRTAEMQPTSGIYRRATSTGAAFIHKRRALRQGVDDHSSNSDHDDSIKVQRRALSGDWNIGLLKRGHEQKLPVIIDDSSAAASRKNSNVVPLAPSPLPVGRRAVSVYSPLSSLRPDHRVLDHKEMKHNPILSLDDDGDESTPRGRHNQKWKNVATWFRKLSGR